MTFFERRGSNWLGEPLELSPMGDTGPSSQQELLFDRCAYRATNEDQARVISDTDFASHA